MKLSATSTRRQAFTLIELLVVIAIIGILFTLVSPQISKARLRGKLTQQAAKARYIVEAITAKEGASRFSFGWPKSGDTNATSSTEFLISLVNEGYLDVEFSFFAGPGMRPAIDEDDFRANPVECNAWCVMLDLDDTTPGNFPAVYLKNFDLTTMSFAEDAEPLGNKGFAFATKNGEAMAVEQAEMNDETVFSAIFNLRDADNPLFLEP
jgi:prepilin-type N-terminal cleavage/methylation domain-containing protein